MENLSVENVTGRTGKRRGEAGSAMAVNRLVAGSNPARGATYCLFIQRRPCPYLGSVLSL